MADTEDDGPDPGSESQRKAMSNFFEAQLKAIEARKEEVKAEKAVFEVMGERYERHPYDPASQQHIEQVASPKSGHPELNWNNLNDRMQFIVDYIKKEKKFSTANFEIINKKWKEELGTVSQSRFSQLITKLLDEGWLTKTGSRGTGSYRFVELSSNAKSNIGKLDTMNIGGKPKPSNSHKYWNDEQNDELKSLYDSGKTIAEIAESMGRTESSIRSKIHIGKFQKRN